MEKYQTRKGRTLFLYLLVCCKHFSEEIQIINSHHLFLVSHVFNSSVAFDANFLRSFLFIPSKILRIFLLLFLGGNVVMWANKILVVSDLVDSLRRLCSKFSRLLLSLGNGGKTYTFADIFIVVNNVFTTTFTYLMNIHSQIYWCNTFTDIFYTTISAVKKINIVPNFTMTSIRFNVYGRIDSFCYVWFHF